MLILGSQTLLGGGAWTNKMHRVMQKEYSLSEEQYSKMVAQLIRDTKLNMAIKTSDLSLRPSKSCNKRQGMWTS